ncbi:MAG: PQQ-binding-like beta-propeller repeat protein [Candidatus Binataceae bacterium]
MGTDGTIYIGCGDNHLYAVNPDGTQKWKLQIGKSPYSPPAIGADGTIYIGSKNHKLYAVKPNGVRKWAFTSGGSIHSAPVVGADGTIYIGPDGVTLYAVRPTGTQKWVFAAGGFVGAAPAIGADGTVYFGSLVGNIYAVGATSPADATVRVLKAPDPTGAPDTILSSGSFQVTNTGSGKEDFNSVLIAFSDAAVFTGAELRATRGRVAASATVMNPASVTTFTLNKSISLDPGKTLRFHLKVTVAKGVSCDFSTQRVTALSVTGASTFSGLPAILGTISCK